MSSASSLADSYIDSNTSLSDTANKDSKSQDGLSDRSAVSVMGHSLPADIMIRIASYLDPADIASLKYLTHRWNNIFSNDSVWKELLYINYGHIRIFAPTSQLYSWRDEFVQRYRIAHKWRRSKGLNISSDAHNHIITDSYPYFAGRRSIFFCRDLGRGTIMDPESGRVSKRVIFMLPNAEVSPVSCVDASRFAVFAGFSNGSTSAVILSHQATVHTRIEMKRRFTDGYVSAVWLEKSEEPKLKRAAESYFNGISGSSNGELLFFSLATGDCVHNTRLDNNSPVTSICADSRSGYSLICNQRNIVYFLQNSDIVEKYDFSTETVSHESTTTIYEDFTNGIFIAVVSGKLFRVTLPMNDFDSKVEKYIMNTECKLHCIQPFSGKFNELKPGRNGRLIATVSPDLVTIELYASHSFHQHSNLSTVRRIKRESYTAITCITMNSAVIVAGLADGSAEVYDALSGNLLTIIMSKDTKRFYRLLPHLGETVINRLYSAHQVCVDPDPRFIRGYIILGQVVRFFDYSNSSSNKHHKTAGVVKPAAGRSGRRQSRNSGSGHEDIREAVRADIEQFHSDQLTEREYQVRANQFNGQDTGMTFEEQLEYAVALSQSEQLSVSEDEEAQVRLALELSVAESQSDTDGVDQNDDEIDEELANILRLSLTEQ
ncbi:hypothetical protein CANCADRAFT_132944 [Tortispora caseinolytica NRRL Y-17796]|uniref:F-box domain-containing protein n=1 Tax=Tortispora caseinolytica NRRL Y-17796 TaxID=767744 RepID=A0A1E4TB93_9ASCO|nr:hypothetical protein CANCADRAFT_132944 [Tortispora caseinolytica NRRL Y-17796]